MSKYVQRVNMEDMEAVCEFLPGRCECGELAEPGEDFCDECKRSRTRRARDTIVFEDRTPPSEWKVTEWGMW